MFRGTLQLIDSGGGAATLDIVFPLTPSAYREALDAYSAEPHGKEIVDLKPYSEDFAYLTDYLPSRISFSDTETLNQINHIATLYEQALNNGIYFEPDRFVGWMEKGLQYPEKDMNTVITALENLEQLVSVGGIATHYYLGEYYHKTQFGIMRKAIPGYEYTDLKYIPEHLIREHGEAIMGQQMGIYYGGYYIGAEDPQTVLSKLEEPKLIPESSRLRLEPLTAIISKGALDAPEQEATIYLPTTSGKLRDTLDSMSFTIESADSFFIKHMELEPEVDDEGVHPNPLQESIAGTEALPVCFMDTINDMAELYQQTITGGEAFAKLNEVVMFLDVNKDIALEGDYKDVIDILQNMDHFEKNEWGVHRLNDQGFHYYSLDPPNIRNRIWEEAIRDLLPPDRIDFDRYMKERYGIVDGDIFLDDAASPHGAVLINQEVDSILAAMRIGCFLHRAGVPAYATSLDMESVVEMAQQIENGEVDSIIDYIDEMTAGCDTPELEDEREGIYAMLERPEEHVLKYMLEFQLDKFKGYELPDAAKQALLQYAEDLQKSEWFQLLTANKCDLAEKMKGWSAELEAPFLSGLPEDALSQFHLLPVDKQVNMELQYNTWLTLHQTLQASGEKMLDLCNRMLEEHIHDYTKIRMNREENRDPEPPKPHRPGM